MAFKDYLWESLNDPAAGLSMIETAEKLAKSYGIARADVDAFAARSFERAVKAQADGWFEGEVVPVENETFELEGYRPRRLRLSGKSPVADRDTHPRLSPADVLAKLRPVFADGVQTGGTAQRSPMLPRQHS